MHASLSPPQVPDSSQRRARDWLASSSPHLRVAAAMTYWRLGGPEQVRAATLALDQMVRGGPDEQCQALRGYGIIGGPLGLRIPVRHRAADRSELLHFDRLLIATSAVTGALIPAEPHQALLSEVQTLGRDPLELESDPRYRDLVIPMRAIRERTRIALLTVLVLGLSALSAGLIIAWLIAQRLSRPMRQLKTLAARATTGSSARLAAAPQLIPELRPIAEAIETLRARLRQSRDEARLDIQALRARRLQDSALDWLSARLPIETESLGERLALILARRGDWRLAWLTAEDKDLTAEDPVRRRRRVDLIDLLRRLWERGTDDPATWPSRVGEPAALLLLPGEGSLLALASHGRVMYLAGNPITSDADGPIGERRGF